MTEPTLTEEFYDLKYSIIEEENRGNPAAIKQLKEMEDKILQGQKLIQLVKSKHFEYLVTFHSFCTRKGLEVDIEPLRKEIFKELDKSKGDKE